MDSTRFLKERTQVFKRSLACPISNVQPKTTTLSPIVPSKMGSKNLLSDCCIPGCPSSKWNQQRSRVCFHPFPPAKAINVEEGAPLVDMRSLWIRLLFPDGVNGSRDLPWSSMSVCSEHFEPHEYCKANKGERESVLRPNAIPTLNLGHGYSVTELLTAVNDVTSDSEYSEDYGPSPTLRDFVNIKQEMVRQEEDDDCEIITADFDQDESTPSPSHSTFKKLLNGSDSAPTTHKLGHQPLIDMATPILVDPGNGILVDANSQFVVNSASPDIPSLTDDSNSIEDVDLGKYSMTDAFIKSIQLMEQESIGAPVQPVSEESTANSTPTVERAGLAKFPNISVKLMENKTVGVKETDKSHLIKRPFGFLGTATKEMSSIVSKSENTTKKSVSQGKSGGVRKVASPLKDARRSPAFKSSPGKVATELQKSTGRHMSPKENDHVLTSQELVTAAKAVASDHNYCSFFEMKRMETRCKKEKLKEEEDLPAEKVVSLTSSSSSPNNIKIPRRRRRFTKPASKPTTPQKFETSHVTDKESQQRMKEYHDYYLCQIRLAVSYKYRRATYNSYLNDVIPCPHCVHRSKSVADIQSHLSRHRQIHCQLKMLKCALCSYATVFFSALVDHDETTHYNVERDGKTMKELGHAEIIGLLSLVSRSKGVSQEFNIFPGSSASHGRYLERFWPIVTKEFNRMYPPLEDCHQYRSELFLKCRFYTLKKLALKLMKQETGESSKLTFADEIRVVRSFVDKCVKSNRSIFESSDKSKSSPKSAVSLTKRLSSSSPIVSSLLLSSPLLSSRPSDSLARTLSPSSSESDNVGCSSLKIKREPGEDVKNEGLVDPTDDDLSTSTLRQTSPVKVKFTLGEENKIIQALPGRKEVFIVDINKITASFGTNNASETPAGEATQTKAGKHVICSSVASKFESAISEQREGTSRITQSSPSIKPSATGTFPCPQCASEFKLEKNLERHMTWHRAKAARDVTQIAHQARVHLNPAIANNFNCDCCEFSACSIEELEAHMTSHFRVAEEDDPKVEEKEEMIEDCEEAAAEIDKVAVATDDDDEDKVAVETDDDDDDKVAVETDDDDDDKIDVLPEEDNRELSESFPKEKEASEESELGDDDGDESRENYSDLDYSDDDSDPDFDDLDVFRIDSTKLKKTSKQFQTLKKEFLEEKYWDFMAKKSFEKEHSRFSKEAGGCTKGKTKKKKTRKEVQKQPILTKSTPVVTTPKKKQASPPKPKPSPKTSRKSAPPKSKPFPEVPALTVKETSPKLDDLTIVREAAALSAATALVQPRSEAPALKPAVVEFANENYDPAIVGDIAEKPSPRKSKTTPLKSIQSPVVSVLTPVVKTPRVKLKYRNRNPPTILDEAAAIAAAQAVVVPTDSIACDKCSYRGNAHQLRLHQTWNHSEWKHKTDPVDSDFVKQSMRKKRRRKLDSLDSVCGKRKKKVQPPRPESILPLEPTDHSTGVASALTDSTADEITPTPILSPGARRKRHSCFYCIYTCFSRKGMIDHIAEQRHLEPIAFVRKRVKITNKKIK